MLLDFGTAASTRRKVHRDPLSFVVHGSNAGDNIPGSKSEARLRAEQAFGVCSCVCFCLVLLCVISAGSHRLHHMSYDALNFCEAIAETQQRSVYSRYSPHRIECPVLRISTNALHRFATPRPIRSSGSTGVWGGGAIRATAQTGAIDGGYFGCPGRLHNGTWPTSFYD